MLFILEFYIPITLLMHENIVLKKNNHIISPLQVDKADPAYPRSTSVWWFDCQSASNEDLSKASLSGGDNESIYVGTDGDYHDLSTANPTQGDYVDEVMFDGSEKQDSELQENGEDSTPIPRQEALDGNSASIFSNSKLYTSFIIAFIVHFLRLRFL